MTSKTTASFRIGQNRLLKLADILDEAQKKYDRLKASKKFKKGEMGYDQKRFVHECGTPACALGHWAVHNPRRWRVKDGIPAFRGVMDPLSASCYQYGARRVEANGVTAATKDFGINLMESVKLFDGDGCGNARKASTAAKYIRRFVARRQRDRLTGKQP